MPFKNKKFTVINGSNHGFEKQLAAAFFGETQWRF